MRVSTFLASGCLVAATPVAAQTASVDTSPQGGAQPSATNANGAPDAPLDIQPVANGESSTPDDIVVTAQRRDEGLSRTPVAVTVVSATTLAEAQITRSDDLR